MKYKDIEENKQDPIPIAAETTNKANYEPKIIDEDEGSYEGKIEYEMKNGLGCFLWHNGNFYNGNWKDDKMEGIGTLYYANGGKIKGNFLRGQLHGFGRCWYSNGDCYVGMWKEGKFDGKGVFFTNKSNIWVLGDFLSGNMQTEQKSGQGKPHSVSKPLNIKYRNKS